MRSASKSPEVSLPASRESEMVSTATPNAVNARSISILPPGMLFPPGRSAQLVADDLVHRFGLGSAELDQLFELCGRSFSEDSVLERGCVDVDVERGAAQPRVP